MIAPRERRGSRGGYGGRATGRDAGAHFLLEAPGERQGLVDLLVVLVLGASVLVVQVFFVFFVLRRLAAGGRRLGLRKTRVRTEGAAARGE